MENDNIIADRSESSRTLKPQTPMWVRYMVQLGFLLLVIAAGIKFGAFVKWLELPGAAAAPQRPPSAEAFLPISSFMNLIYFLKTGTVNRVHPAGFVIFTLTIVLSLVAGRGFCSWVCPIGTISEYAHKAGRRFFGFNIVPPKWIDLPLRSVKYILLGFFSYAILRMSGESLRMFLDGPYNRIVDVKMYLFFAHISRTALMILLILLWLSILVRNFWCRYLCPYGALLGLVSAVAPVTVRRDSGACIDCGACARACPNCVAVNTKERMDSPECMSCYSCVRACPSPGALRVSARRGGRAVSTTAYAMILIAAFLMVTQIAPVFGLWRSATTPHQYKKLYAMIYSIGHPGPESPGAPGGMPPGHSLEPPSGEVNMNSSGQYR